MFALKNSKKIQFMKIYKSKLKKHPFSKSLESIRSLASIRGSGYKLAAVLKLLLVRNNLNKK